MMRGSGSSRRYCFKRQATSWTLASEGMEGLPESRVPCVCEVMNQYTLLRERGSTFKAFCLATEPAFLKIPSLVK